MHKMLKKDYLILTLQFLGTQRGRLKVFFSFNTNFWTTRFPLSIIYLPTQINIVYQKNAFKRKFARFLIHKYKYLSDLFRKNDKYMFKV